jgi:hypothetical protein
MPGSLKITLTITALLFLAGIATCVVQISKFRHFPEDIQAASAEGRAFGRGKDTNACVSEALARATARCSRFDQSCLPKVQLFLMNCLNTADETEAFCASIPPHRPLSFGDRWAVDDCARRGYKHDPRCIGVMTTVQIHCSARRRR